MSRIHFLKVSKRFQSFTAIENLNLTIREGEFMVLVGPSGCAKSTTLRMIAGLEAISAGELWIGETLANALEPGQRNVAMVFQSYALFPNMDVYGNLAFGMQIRGGENTVIKAEVKRVAELLGLTLLLKRKPRELSGGQAQRVALGRALIRQPQAFLFDEPLSNLDAELRVQMRGEISRLQKELGTTTVYVTHDQTEAMTMGDRVAVMQAGRIMQVSEPLTLYKDPDNLFVAGFIGSPKMNFIELSQGQSTLFGMPLPAKLLPARLPPRVTLGLRPESLQMADKTEATLLTIQLRLERREALGHETLLHAIEPASGQPLVIRSSVAEFADASPGSLLDFSIDPANLLFFDRDSGQRLRRGTAL